MSDSVVTWLRPPGGAGYSEPSALNDIHAMLTTSTASDGDLRADVGQILARTGRPMVPVRDIDVVVTETRTGRPVARVDAAPTAVTVRQEPAGTGLLIEITSARPDGPCPAVITIRIDDGQRHPSQPGDAA